MRRGGVRGGGFLQRHHARGHHHRGPDGNDRGPLSDWRDGRNDLEAPALELAPLIGDVLDWLRTQQGANFVRMSGSGATCFALFDHEAERDAAAAACPSNWWHLATFLR